jgi:hypothetical protein
LRWRLDLQTRNQLLQIFWINRELASDIEVEGDLGWGDHFDIEESNPRCVEPAQMDRDLFEKQWWGD